MEPLECMSDKIGEWREIPGKGGVDNDEWDGCAVDV
jgi:hypothetical protein